MIFSSFGSFADLREMLNELLETWEVWKQMETELQSVVHHDTVSDAMVFRVLRLGKEMLIHLEIIFEDSLQMVTWHNGDYLHDLRD